MASFTKFVSTLLLLSTSVPSALSFPSQPQARSTNAANDLSGKTIRLLPLGDSITFGMGSTGMVGYRAGLQQRLSKAGANVTLIGSVKLNDYPSESFPGYMIEQIAGLADNALPLRPNVITLMAGTNDVAWGGMVGASVADAPKRLAALLDKLIEKAPDAAILVATLTPLGGFGGSGGLGGGLAGGLGGLFGGGRTGGSGGSAGSAGSSGSSSSSSSTDNIKAFNDALPGVVQERAAKGAKVAIASMAAITVGELADGVHPNEAGYVKMADSFFAAIDAASDKGWIGEPVAVPADAAPKSNNPAAGGAGGLFGGFGGGSGAGGLGALLGGAGSGAGGLAGLLGGAGSGAGGLAGLLGGAGAGSSGSPAAGAAGGLGALFGGAGGAGVPTSGASSSLPGLSSGGLPRFPTLSGASSGAGAGEAADAGAIVDAGAGSESASESAS